MRLAKTTQLPDQRREFPVNTPGELQSQNRGGQAHVLYCLFPKPIGRKMSQTPDFAVLLREYPMRLSSRAFSR